MRNAHCCDAQGQGEGAKARQAAAARKDAQPTLSLPAAKEQDMDGAGSVTFIGTATVLIRYAGMTILTDPNFLHKGDHVHLGYGLTSERQTDPAITIDQLPQIDLIVLSHMHGDHFDQLVQDKLSRDIPTVSTPHAAKELEEMGFKKRYGLNTWDTLVVKKVMPVCASPPCPAAMVLLSPQACCRM